MKEKIRNLKSFGYGMLDGAVIGMIGYGVGQVSQGNFFQTSEPLYAVYATLLASSLAGGLLSFGRNRNRERKELTDQLK